MKDLSGLDLAFWSGLQGGVIGGVVAAVPIVVAHYAQPGAALSEAAELVLYTLLVGAAIGISALAGMSMSSRLGGSGPWSTWLANIIGAIVACALAGTLMGLVGARWFRPWPYEVARPDLVLGAALLGAAALGSAVVLYDTGGQLPRMLPYCLLPIPVSGAVAFAASRTLELDAANLSVTSAQLGLAAGVVMGLQIGLGLSSYRRRTWPGRDSQPDQS